MTKIRLILLSLFVIGCESQQQVPLLPTNWNTNGAQGTPNQIGNNNWPQNNQIPQNQWNPNQQPQNWNNGQQPWPQQPSQNPWMNQQQPWQPRNWPQQQPLQNPWMNQWNNGQQPQNPWMNQQPWPQQPQWNNGQQMPQNPWMNQNQGWNNQWNPNQQWNQQNVDQCQTNQIQSCFNNIPEYWAAFQSIDNNPTLTKQEIEDHKNALVKRLSNSNQNCYNEKKENVKKCLKQQSDKNSLGSEARTAYKNIKNIKENMSLTKQNECQQVRQLIASMNPTVAQELFAKIPALRQYQNNPYQPNNFYPQQPPQQFGYQPYYQYMRTQKLMDKRSK